MEKTKDRGGLNFIVALMVIGGTILFVLGIVVVGEVNHYLGLNVLYINNGITYIVSGLTLILAGISIAVIGNVLYESRDAAVMHMRMTQKHYNRPVVVRESGFEPAEWATITLDWSKSFVKDWPLQLTEFQISYSGGEYWGQIVVKNLTQEIIDYFELELQYLDYLGRKIELDDKQVIKGLIDLNPNAITTISNFILPFLISDVQATLIGVRYKSGEVALMPEEVERYSLPNVKGLTGSKAFLKFISSYLEGRGFDVIPTYYYDSTPTHWNCVFCGTINEQKDNSCASCKRERQIQHFAREEFLWKKFEESSST